MAYTFAVSAKTGEGVEALVEAIAAMYKDNGLTGGEVLTEERHISALYEAKRAVKSAVGGADNPVDCILIDLRAAYDALGTITGKTATENIVDSIFSKFCVGK